ncbi:MAG: hypothetical protein R3Y32_00670 [Bacillota bacterium]
MMRKKLALLLVLCLVLSCFAGCGSSSTTDVEETVTIKFSVGFGNSSRTMTYNQTTPLTLSDGTVVTQGMLKPVWTYIEGVIGGVEFVDVTDQSADADDMIATASTTGFTSATVYGGNSIATDLINYGAAGYFISLSDAMDAGKMPNFTAYLDANPDVASAITAYDGNIYHVPYTAEIGTSARHFVARQTWITTLLDGGASYDTSTTLTTYYEAFYGEGNYRTGEYGGTVNPSEDVYITKATDESIIEIMNALSVKNGETLATALVEYIERNYDYENPSELYLGTSAAYDIDELVALLRVVKTNPTLLTDGEASEVWPFFTRYSKYREDTLKLITYMDGVKVNGSDSYSALWSFSDDGQIYYTYTEEAFYDGLVKLSQMYAEGLFYSDTYDESNTAVYRTTLYGSDDSDNASFGFMTYDWISSTTSESLNADTTVVMCPVAEINGTWQYYNENTRVIKPDGWSISSAATEAEQDAALKVMDYMFSEEGMIVVNYGLPQDIVDGEYYDGPDGVEYPLLSDWTWTAANTYTSGDASTFLRDYMGSIMAVGFVKSIGMEYQTTGAQGFASWEVVNNSNMVFSSYAGDGTDNSNGSDYYSKLIPPAFSMTTRQTESLENTTIETDEVGEYIFNIIQYQALGNAPSGTTMAYSFDEFYQLYVDAGIELYVSTYQDAYAAMAGI